MKTKFTFSALVLLGVLCFSQDVKIKKGDIFLDKQAVAKIEKQKGGYKISSLDGGTWLLANVINITQTQKVAPKYWLELTGLNGNLREVEYRKIDFTMSREKWLVEALLNSDTGLFATNGLSREVVEQFFQTQDRRVSDTWDRIIEEQRAQNASEDALAKQDKVVFDGRTIKRQGEVVGFIQTKEIPKGTLIHYTSAFFDGNKNLIAQIAFYREENLNQDGLKLELRSGEEQLLNQVEYSFSRIDLADLTKRAVHRLNALGFLNVVENPNEPKYMNSRERQSQRP